MSVIQLKKIGVVVNGKTMLEDITFSLAPNCHLVITGHNGAGKTVLARVLSGKQVISSGELIWQFDSPGQSFDNVQMVSFTDNSSLFHSVNNRHYYQQRFNSWDSYGHLTVAQYLQLNGVNPQADENLTFLKQMGIYDLLTLERIKLSSGQNRKMLLARALLKRPRVLIIDNLFLGLDARSRAFINDFLDGLVRNENIMLILTGHFTSLPKVITHHADLAAGRLKNFGSLDRRRMTATGIARTNTEVLDKIVSACQNSGPRENMNEIVRFEDVTIRYGQRTLLDGMSFRIHQGERWILRGDNGSGKSLILSLIYGDNPQAYAQKIFLFGSRRGSGESIWEIKRKIGYTSPELHAYLRTKMSLTEVILSVLTPFIGLRMKGSEGQTHLVKLFLQYYNIEKFKDQSFSTLPTGIQRIALFLGALVKCPPLLLLDEPFQGMDAQNIQHSQELLDACLQKDQTLIFISHFISEEPSKVDHYLTLGNQDNK